MAGEWVKKLDDVLAASGMRVTFDPLRDTTIGCSEKCAAWTRDGNLLALPDDGLCRAHFHARTALLARDAEWREALRHAIPRGTKCLHGVSLYDPKGCVRHTGEPLACRMAPLRALLAGGARGR